MPRPQCLCCVAQARGQDPRKALVDDLRAKIAAVGWAVRGVFLEADPTRAFLYTIGLTEAGLPELIAFDAYTDSLERATGILNAFARRSLKTEFKPGEVHRIANITATVQKFDRREHLGSAQLLYGKGNYRVLTLDIPAIRQLG